MPVANKPTPKPNKKKERKPYGKGPGVYVKKADGVGTDATAPNPRDARPLAKDGTRRGRLPGTKTRAQQLLEDAQEFIRKKHGVENFHPIVYMLSVAADEDNDETLRLNAANKAAPYVVPALRSVEIGGTDGKPIQVDLTSSKDKLRRMAGLVDAETSDE